MRAIDKLVLFVGLAICGGLLALVLPVAWAIADTWTPARTDNLLIGGFAVCGGVLALPALAAGLTFGIRLAGTRSASTQTQQQPPVIYAPPQAALAPWEAEYRQAQVRRLEAQAARDLLRLEVDKRELLTQPADPWANLSTWEVVE